MPIEFQCPNGHQLRIADRFGGRKCRCPNCKTILLVPSPLTEDQILEVVGDYQDESLPVHQEMSIGGDDRSSILGSSILRQENRACPKCKDMISASFRVCPHCHYYMADWHKIAK